MENEVFEHMSVPKAYLKLSMPLVLSMVISLIYNLVDTFFIAKTGNASLVAGVSLCAPLFTLMVAFGDIFALGGSSLISRLLGQRDHEKVRHISAFCLIGSILFGIVIAVIMTLFSQPILTMLGAKADTMPFAASYYKWLILGAPAIIFNIVPGNLLRTEGMAMEVMFGSILGAVINIILDPVFIFSLRMGAGGAAAATILSNLISDVFLAFIVIKKSRSLSFLPKDISITAVDLKDILTIGIPASITNIMQSLAVLLINRQLVGYGTDKVAALGIALKVNMVAMLIMVGFAFGAQPLLGYNYGSGNKKRLGEILRFDILMELCVALVFLLLSFLLAPHLIGIFMQDDSIISNGALMLRLLMVTAPCISVILVMTTYFQAAGQALPAFILAASRQGIVLAVCLALLPHLFGYMGILASQAASDAITLIIAIILFRLYRMK